MRNYDCNIFDSCKRNDKIEILKNRSLIIMRIVKLTLRKDGITIWITTSFRLIYMPRTILRIDYEATFSRPVFSPRHTIDLRVAPLLPPSRNIDLSSASVSVPFSSQTRAWPRKIYSLIIPGHVHPGLIDSFFFFLIKWSKLQDSIIINH